jgi:hypothetical protein
MAMSRQVVLTFFPLYIQIGLGRDALELGIYVALLHGMGTVSQPVLGVVADRMGRKAVLVPSFLLLSGFYLLLARVAPGWPLGVLVLAIGMFFYTLVNITTAAVLDVASLLVDALTGTRRWPSDALSSGGSASRSRHWFCSNGFAVPGSKRSSRTRKTYSRPRRPCHSGITRPHGRPSSTKPCPASAGANSTLPSLPALWFTRQRSGL